MSTLGQEQYTGYSRDISLAARLSYRRQSFNTRFRMPFLFGVTTYLYYRYILWGQQAMLTRKIITALLALTSLSALAADYYLVVPVKGKASAPIISVSLQSGQLPQGLVGQAYSYDLKPYLLVTGDADLNLGVATWSASGLPSGLVMTNGTLSGSPAGASTGSIYVTATYKGKSANQAYSLTVVNPRSIVLQGAGYRTWSDGSLAQSCLNYTQPSAQSVYSGDTGDGFYRVQPAGQQATTVYCDMTKDGGGWTLVSRVVSGSNAHVDTAAVGTLTAPGQASPAKLSDAFINSLMDSSSGVMRLSVDGNLRVNYFKLAGTPFVAVGAAAVRPVSTSLNGAYVNTTVNGAHGGLNSHGVLPVSSFLVYGPATAGDTCRIGIARDGPTGWCGQGASGTLFVR